MSGRGTPEVTAVSAFFGAIVGRKTADVVNRHRMAVLLATLVLLVLASPIGDVVSGARLVLAGATVAFMLAALQQADAYPRLRLLSRLMALVWLVLNLLQLRWEGPWLRGAAAVALAAVVFSVLWLVARRLMTADRVDAELLCSAVGAYLLLGIFWAVTYEIISLAAPAAFTGPSIRSMRLPMSVRFSAAGQSTLAISRPSLLGGIHHCEHHAGIGAAATEIAAQTGAHLFEGGVGMVANKGRASHDETGRAESALLGVVVHKSLLDFVHLFRAADPFDGRDFTAFGLDGKHGAGINRVAIDQHRAGAAGAAVANFLATGEVEPVAQCVEQGHARFDIHAAALSIDLKRDR